MSAPFPDSTRGIPPSSWRAKPRIAVIGGDDAGAESRETAFEMGRRIAAEGFILITGGRGGVMEAACRGAKTAGGMVLGILPGLDRNEANPWVDIAVTTGMGHLRNALVVSNADYVVAVAGAYGTLSEIAHASILGIPVFGLGTWEISGVIALESPARVMEQILKSIETR